MRLGACVFSGGVYIHLMTTTKTEAAEKIEAAINAGGRWKARAWEGGSNVRVYISEKLARGVKECGFIEILDGCDLNMNPIHSGPKAAIREAAKAALA